MPPEMIIVNAAFTVKSFDCTSDPSGREVECYGAVRLISPIPAHFLPERDARPPLSNRVSKLLDAGVPLVGDRGQGAFATADIADHEQRSRKVGEEHGGHVVAETDSGSDHESLEHFDRAGRLAQTQQANGHRIVHPRRFDFAFLKKLERFAGVARVERGRNRVQQVGQFLRSRILALGLFELGRPLVARIGIRLA